MKKIMKRTFALLLAMVLVAGMVPHFAVEAEAAGNLTATQGAYTVTLKSISDVNLDDIDHIEITNFEVTSNRISVYICVYTTDNRGSNFGFGFNNKPCTAENGLNETTQNWDEYGSKVELTITRAKQDHSGGEATCSAKAVCGTCKQEYGDTLPHNCTYAVVDGTITETCTNNDCGHKAVASLTANTLTYNGQAQTGLTMTNSGWVGTAPVVSATATDAGTHTGTMTHGGLSVTKKFTIDYAPLTVTADAKTVTYGDAVPELTYTITGFANGETAETALSGMPEIQMATTYEPGMGVGDYEITFVEDSKVQTYGNYEFTFYVPGKVTVGKAVPTFTAPTAKKLTYNGQPQALVNPGSTLVGEMQYSMAEDGTYGTGIPVGETADTYKVWYKVVVPETDANYTSSTPSFVEVKIGKARSTYAAPTPIQGLEYDGTAQELINAGTSGHGTFRYALVEKPTDEVAESEWNTTVPAAINAGTHYVKYQLIGDDNHTNSEIGCIETTIAKIDPEYTVPTAVEGLVYNGQEQDLVEASTTSGTFTFELDGKAAEPKAKDAGDYELIWTFTPTDTTNYNVVTGTEPIAVTIGKLTLTDALAATCEALTWDGTEKTATLSEVKMNGLDVTYSLSGNKATNVGVHKMKLTGTGNFQGEVELEFYIMPDEDILKDITEENVTTDDPIEDALKMVETADTSGFPTEQKAAVDADLKEIEENAKNLEAALNEALAAKATDEVKAGQAITADNAKVSDKKALEDAKADLEAALTTYATNYTLDEQNAINAEITRINGILANINDEDVAEAIDDIEALPKSVEPDDEKSDKKIQAAQKVYDDLTAAQKKIVDNSTDGKLAKLQAELRDIDVVSISHTKWYRTSKKDLTIKFNGPFGKFDHLEVNGKKLDTKHYTAKEGSTIITLKASYLETLTTRKENTVVAVYKINGEEVKSEAATFTAYKYASNAATGDMFNPLVWVGIGGFSIAALVVLLILMKKKKVNPPE